MSDEDIVNHYRTITEINVQFTRQLENAKRAFAYFLGTETPLTDELWRQRGEQIAGLIERLEKASSDAKNWTSATLSRNS